MDSRKLVIPTSVFQNSKEEENKSETPAPLPCHDDKRGMSFRTGTGIIMNLNPTVYNDQCEEYEPISVPKERILEDCIRREIERLAIQETCLNNLVYDSSSESSYEPVSATDYTLVFESRFESGNLQKAVQVFDFEYDLILKPDFNTRGNTQWFFFSVGNTRAGRVYRFNIINMMKPDSLYNYGMKPCLYSSIEATQHNKGWYRDGTDICYYQNNIKRKTGCYFTLTFALTFKYDFDTVSIAHCYPYTYTDLNSYLNKLVSDPKKKNRVRRKLLCHTIAGNSCDILTITSFLSDEEAIKERKGVFLMARVHPGESNASWMMKGLIEYLVGPSLDAKILRDNFVFKIVPMLNPDGVINGSYRCGLAGVDLNRQWIDPSRRYHPTIFHTKAAFKQFLEEHEVILACDLHGHSRKKNIFMYGCTSRYKLHGRIFPKLMEKASETFSYSDCVFGLQKAKEATARIVFFKEFDIINSFTLESSFCGASKGKHCDFHFSVKHLLEVGHDFCDSVLDFCDPDESKVRMTIEELEMEYPLDEEEEELVEEEEEIKKKKKKRKAVVKKRVAEKRKAQ